MRALANARLVDPRRSLAPWLVLALLCVPALGRAAEFKILHASVHLAQGVYLVDADIRYGLTKPVEKALRNSVPLTFVTTMEVRRPWFWLWDKTVASLQQRFRLQYHALAQQYVVTNLNNDALHSFPTLDAALDFMGKLRGFPLLDRSLLDPTEHYRLWLQTALDIEALPAPLRPVAYLSGAWRLSSDWYSCPL